jgi:hypothetical protein
MNRADNILSFRRIHMHGSKDDPKYEEKYHPGDGVERGRTISGKIGEPQEVNPTDPSKEKMKASGDCFENCSREFLTPGGSHLLPKDAENVRILHGWAVGTGGEAEGIRYPHAWIEYNIPIEGLDPAFPPVRMAMDITSPERLINPVIVPAGMYRNLGNIEVVAEYTEQEARNEMVRTGQFGPWATELINWLDGNIE